MLCGKMQANWKKSSILVWRITMAYDFDRQIDRRSSDSVKWNRYDENILPLWVADMDFKSPEAVIRALRERVEHGVFGYGTEPPKLRK